MKVEIPQACVTAGNHAAITCAEKGRKITFLNPAKRLLTKYVIDGCRPLRGLLADPMCQLCDYLVVDWRSREHYVELKGSRVEHALNQLSSTISQLSSTSPTDRVFCWIVTTESPSTQSKFQVLKAKFEKRLNARVVIRTNRCEHTLNGD
jgi:hypothetical protein